MLMASLFLVISGCGSDSALALIDRIPQVISDKRVKGSAFENLDLLTVQHVSSLMNFAQD